MVKHARRFPTLASVVFAAAVPLVLLSTVATAAGAMPAPPAKPIEEYNMLNIRIVAEGAVIAVTLDDNATSRDFVSLLPLTLSLEDYAATEKVSDLPKRLSTTGAPPGMTPVAGDFTYYAPWGNLAIFHKDFRYSTGLIKLGHINVGLATLRRAGPLKATISVAREQSAELAE